jgi:hypothetical protein
LKEINKRFKTESIIRIIIAIVGILTFTISTSFGWGFILGGLISKENISLRTKEGWGLLALIVIVMLVALYFLLDITAIYGYLASTIFYFILRDTITYLTKDR